MKQFFLISGHMFVISDSVCCPWSCSFALPLLGGLPVGVDGCCLLLLKSSLLQKEEAASLSLSWQGKCCPANMCQSQSNIFVSSLLEGPNWAWAQDSPANSVHMEIITCPIDRLCHKNLGCCWLPSLPEQTLLSHALLNACQDLQGLFYRTVPHPCLYRFEGLFTAKKAHGFAFVLEFIRLLWVRSSRTPFWMAAMTSSILAVPLNLLPAANLIGMHSIHSFTLVGWFDCCRKEWDRGRTHPALLFLLFSCCKHP